MNTENKQNSILNDKDIQNDAKYQSEENISKIQEEIFFMTKKKQRELDENYKEHVIHSKSAYEYLAAFLQKDENINAKSLTTKRFVDALGVFQEINQQEMEEIMDYHQQLDLEESLGSLLIFISGLFIFYSNLGINSWGILVFMVVLGLGNVFTKHYFHHNVRKKLGFEYKLSTVDETIIKKELDRVLTENKKFINTLFENTLAPIKEVKTFKVTVMMKHGSKVFNEVPQEELKEFLASYPVFRHIRVFADKFKVANDDEHVPNQIFDEDNIEYKFNKCEIFLDAAKMTALYDMLEPEVISESDSSVSTTDKGDGEKNV